MHLRAFRQFIAFASVGAIGTAVQYTILMLMVEGLATNAILASTLGFAAGAAVNYHLNYKYTFNSDKQHLEAAYKFFVVALIGAGANSLIMYAGMELWHFKYLLAQVVATGTVLIQNFLLNRYWTFATAKAPDQSAK